jgi:hypothetical protein
MISYRPTHRITLGTGVAFDVMVMDGAAYTREEWRSETAADYEYDGEGIWLFQGRPFFGTVRPVEKEG